MVDRKNSMYKAYLYKGRFACHACFATLPLVQTDARLLFLAIGIITSIIVLATDDPTQRKKVLIVWLAGFIASVAIVLVISNWFIQIILYLICLIPAARLLYKMSWNAEKEAE